MDLMQSVKSDVMQSMFCVQLGTIQAYDNLKNTAKITINFKKQFGNGKVVDYPPLEDCPVFTLYGGDASISIPIKKGDQCIILFNDRNIDNWYLNGSTGVPADVRCHSIADGIAIVGVRNLAKAELVPANSLCVNGGSKKVSIKNSSTNLKKLMDSFIDTLMGAQHTVGGTTGAPFPVFGATGLTALSEIKTAFSDLLDEGIL
jgi:hypothetical protein